MGYEADSKRSVQVHYGPRKTEGKFGRGYCSEDRVKTVEYVFSYDGLPVPGTSSLQAVIPAYAKVVDVTFEVITAFAGGTSYDIGLAQSDGTEIDNDGFFAALATASINARGKIVRGAGALCPQLTSTTVGEKVTQALTNIGSAAGELKVVATGTYTAGKAKVIVKYITEGATGL
jgi:hypothetical protein